MPETFEDIERRLRAALAPVDPPVHLQRRLENTLDEIVELAAEELEAWELEALKHPRNWPRAAIGTAGAVVLGGGAAVGLVVLRTQRRRARRQATGVRGLLTDVARETKKLYDEVK